MSKFLAEVTHAVVTTPTKEEATKTGIYAYVELCYGPGDDNAIVAIPWAKVEGGGMAFHAPNTVQLIGGKKEVVPVFRGSLNELVCKACARVIDTIKRDFGKIQFGTKYNVPAGAKGKATLVEPEKKAA